MPNKHEVKHFFPKINKRAALLFGTPKYVFANFLSTPKSHYCQALKFLSYAVNWLVSEQISSLKPGCLLSKSSLS